MTAQLNTHGYRIPNSNIGWPDAKIQSECTHRAIKTPRHIFLGQGERLKCFDFCCQSDLLLLASQNIKRIAHAKLFEKWIPPAPRGRDFYNHADGNRPQIQSPRSERLKCIREGNNRVNRIA